MISKLTIGQGNVEVEGIISEIGEKRTFSKFGRELTVANAVLKDDSGSIRLSLWNDDTHRFKKGDRIKIINGYVNEFQGEKQLTSGKYGSIEKLDSTQKKLDDADSTDDSEETETMSEKSEDMNEENWNESDE